MPTVKPLYLKAILLTWGACLWLMLSACGAAPAADALVVRLSAPDGEQTESFLEGFTRRELTVEKEGKVETIAWLQGSTAELKFDAGAKITFSAYDEAGVRRVGGEAIVGTEKLVTIPLEALY